MKERKNEKISIIAAIDEKNGIGKQGRIPWNIPEDFARFKKLTTGHPVIMGRKTFDSIGRPLPNRTNIIITRDVSLNAPGTIVKSSLNEAIEEAKKHDKKEIFIIGGGQIYQQAIGIADKLYLTMVKGVFKVDTVFPDYSDFKKKTFEKIGESNGFKYTFLELEK